MVAASSESLGRNFERGGWRTRNNDVMELGSGIQVLAPTDPYKPQQRKEFRTATTNSYVHRAMRIAASFTTGQGYTTELVLRKEEDLPDEQLDKIQQTKSLMIPYWNKEMTLEELHDTLDKFAVDLDLGTNLTNAYMIALEQGRCVLAMTPLKPDDNGVYRLPTQLRLIRPELTGRPLLDKDTGELLGVTVVGANSGYSAPNTVPAERMIYIMHGFNNEFLSDYFGDSKVSRISDEANTLNIVLNQDYERGAESAWHKPRVFSVPIPPQEVDNEETILSNFINKVNDSKGQDVAVTGPSNPDETGVTVLQSSPTSDIAGLEIIRTGLIKSIITCFGTPAFMLSEGDVGSLGGNANLSETDGYINQEINPEKKSLESMIERQFGDTVLCILFQTDDARKLPVKWKFKLNKPKLTTLLTPELFQVFTGMMQMQLIDESGVRDILGLEELDKETMSEGADTNPSVNKWNNFKQPVQINMWPDALGNVQSTISGWGAGSKGSNFVDDRWPSNTPQEILNKWPRPSNMWGQKALRSAV